MGKKICARLCYSGDKIVLILETILELEPGNLCIVLRIKCMYVIKSVLSLSLFTPALISSNQYKNVWFYRAVKAASLVFLIFIISKFDFISIWQGIFNCFLTRILASQLAFHSYKWDLLKCFKTRVFCLASQSASCLWRMID